MRYGFVLPRGAARLAADLAYEAEQAGWDGFFVWEPVWGVDAWVSLVSPAAFIAPTAVLIGDVEIGEEARVKKELTENSMRWGERAAAAHRGLARGYIEEEQTNG